MLPGASASVDLPLLITNKLCLKYTQLIFCTLQEIGIFHIYLSVVSFESQRNLNCILDTVGELYSYKISREVNV